MATYAIGDVQGCWDTLCDLLTRIRYDWRSDRLWLAGDLVNRGPASLRVLRWARDQGDRVIAVLGNHDVHLLAAATGLRRPRKRDTLDEVLDAPDRDDLIAWLRSRPVLHREGDVLLVHAGLLPPWTAAFAEDLARRIERRLRGPDWTGLLRRFSGPDAWSDDLDDDAQLHLGLTAMVTLRCVDRAGAMDRDFDGAPDQAPPGLLPWFRHPDRRSRDVRIVCGHWAALGLVLQPDLSALDTGCVWGGALTALRLDDGVLFHQPSRM